MLLEEEENSDGYTIYSSKLVKFRDTKLTPVRFLQSGSRGKMLITFDQRGTIRFHKLRGVRVFQEYEFDGKTQETLDYEFSNLVDTTRIELKFVHHIVKDSTGQIVQQSSTKDKRPPEQTDFERKQALFTSLESADALS